MDPEKDFVADDDEKLSREKLLQRYEMFPMYPTCTPPFLLTLVRPLTCLPFQRSSSPRTSCSRSPVKLPISNPTSRPLPTLPVRTSDMAPSRSEVRTLARAPQPPRPARRLRADASKWKLWFIPLDLPTHPGLLQDYHQVAPDHWVDLPDRSGSPSCRGSPALSTTNAPSEPVRTYLILLYSPSEQLTRTRDDSE